MKMPKNPFSVFSALLICLCLMLSPACRQDAGKTPTIPEAGTEVTTTSAAFKRLAEDLQTECELMGGCTCSIDGIRTNCSIVFSCLEVGFCKLVAID